MEVGKVIPQFFYDLISRVLPGAVGILGGCWATGRSVGELATWPFRGSALEESTVVLSVALLASSYLLGQLLSPLSDFYERSVLRRLFKKRFGVLREAISVRGDYSQAVRELVAEGVSDAGRGDKREYNDEELGSALFVFYDSVRVQRPEVGARLAKIRAEYRLYGSLAVIQPLVLLLHLLGAVLGHHPLNRPAGWVLSVIFLLASWSLVRTYWIFQRSVINNYYAVRADGVRASSPLVEEE